VLIDRIRSLFGKRDQEDQEPSGTLCLQCRKHIGSSDEAELLVAGRILLDDVGWFCGPRCERQYRLLFRIPSEAAASSLPDSAA
jgi:hypothetical protein